MKKTAKILSLALAAAMTLSAFAGCGNGNGGSNASSGTESKGTSSAVSQNSEGSAESTAAGGDGYTITMAYLGNEQPNQDAVMAKIDEQVQKDLGMSFEGLLTVSYTHLDVYKRQDMERWMLHRAVPIFSMRRYGPAVIRNMPI